MKNSDLFCKFRTKMFPDIIKFIKKITFCLYNKWSLKYLLRLVVLYYILYENNPLISFWMDNIFTKYKHQLYMKIINKFIMRFLR